MTFLKAPEASFLVAEKFESLVNCWDGHESEGCGPSENAQPFLTFSLPRAPKNKAPAVENLELKGGFSTDTSLSGCHVLGCPSPLSLPHAKVAF